MATALKSEVKVKNVDTGIEKKDAKALADVVSKSLADSFSLYVKTLGVHWNCTGPTFYSLHKLTEAQYEDLDSAIDALAERVRALGFPAPAGFGDFKKMSVIDSENTLAETESMVEELVSDNQKIAKRLRQFVKVAEEAEDVFTADMLTARIGQHEENSWMLSAMLN